MSQKRAKLINKYLVVTGLKNTGYTTRVRLSGSINGQPRIHTCNHTFERAIKREYNRASHFRKADLAIFYKKIVDEGTRNTKQDS